MPFSKLAIIIMAKHPTPGRVKTRLMPALSAEQAAGVQRVLLRHIVSRMTALSPAELIICFDPADAEREMRELLHPIKEYSMLAQPEGDLGARLAFAAKNVGRQHSRMMFLGVDSPDVPASHLKEAAELTAEVQVSINPTEDGGFWCLGLQREVDAGSLLIEIPWSTGREAGATFAAARALGCTVAMGSPWDDVDRVEDLSRLLHRLHGSSSGTDRDLLKRLDEIIQQPLHPWLDR